MNAYDLSVVYENGVLRPEQALDLPERSHLLISIRRIETDPESEELGRRILREIRQSGSIRLDSWHPTRDEIHERS